MGTPINISGTLLLYEQRGMLSRWMRVAYRRIDGSKWQAHKAPKQRAEQIRIWDGIDFKLVA